MDLKKSKKKRPRLDELFDQLDQLEETIKTEENVSRPSIVFISSYKCTKYIHAILESFISMFSCSWYVYNIIYLLSKEIQV